MSDGSINRDQELNENPGGVKRILQRRQSSLMRDETTKGKQWGWLRTKVTKQYHKWELFILGCFYRTDKAAVRWKYPLRVIPMVNFFFDLFFDDSMIGQEASRSLLDVLGLLNALLLGGVLTLMSAVDYQQMIDADNLWWFNEATFESTYWHEYYNHPPSVQFNIWIGNSLVLFFAGVLIVVYIYADSVSKATRSEKEDDDYPEENLTREQMEERRKYNRKLKDRAEKLYSVWWDKAKYGVFLCFFSTGSACIYAILSVQVLMNIKYPDYYIHETGKYNLSAVDSPTSHLNLFFYMSFGLFCVVTILATGWGTASRYSMEDRFREDDWYSSKKVQLADLQALLLKKKVEKNEDPSQAETEMLLSLLNVMCSYVKFLVVQDEILDAKDVLELLYENEDIIRQEIGKFEAAKQRGEKKIKKIFKDNIFSYRYLGVDISDYILLGAAKLREDDPKHQLAKSFGVHTVDDLIKTLDETNKPNKEMSSRLSLRYLAPTASDDQLVK